ncbi:MAG: glycerate kinase [Chloroflexota bacterium]|nr:glycerate kinase [Chloroflexota bacterium]
MKVVIAPQSFKGSISALDAAKAMEEGVKRVVSDAETVLVPVADGGDGTLETLVEATNGEIRSATVTGPIGKPVMAEWGALGDGETAMIEMARTSGLALLSLDERDPLRATTFGLGEVIREALDAGFRSFIVGIGGSATNDAGAGMAQALGVRLLDESGNDLPPGGAALAALHHIDTSGLDAPAVEAQFSVACDVSNPLTGPEGASAVYGPQKGATPELVEQLDAALRNFARIVERDIGKSINDVPGSGAAGGLGGGMMSFLGGSLRAGVDIVLDQVGLDDKLEGADLVITGEGQLDFQTVYNKAPIGVAWRARERGIPVVAVSGSLGQGFEDVHAEGIDAVASIVSAPMSLEEASTRGEELLADAAAEAMRFMKVGSRVFG